MRDMTLPEPQRGEDPTPEKYICIMDLSLLGQIIKSKIKLKLKISVCKDARKVHCRHLKLNMASWEGGGNAPHPQKKNLISSSIKFKVPYIFGNF